MSNLECIKFMDKFLDAISATTQEIPDAIVILGDMNDRCTA